MHLMNAMEDLINDLRKDAQLGIFLSPDCNVNQIASNLVARDSLFSQRRKSITSNSTINSSSSASSNESSNSEVFLRHIENALTSIDNAIESYVNENHTSLLTFVGSSDSIERDISEVQSSITQLKAQIAQLEEQLTTRHNSLKRIIYKSRNVGKCNDLVRRTLRFAHLSETILKFAITISVQNNEYVNDKIDMNKLACSYQEVDTIINRDSSFSDLTFVRSILPQVNESKTSFEKSILMQLRHGMKHQKVSDIQEAIRLLHSLGTLPKSVQKVVNDFIQRVETKCTAAIAEDKFRNTLTSTNMISGSKEAASVKNISTATVDIWRAFHEIFKVLRVYSVQVWTLQNIMLNMTLPVSKSSTTQEGMRSYLSMVIQPDEPLLFTTFWEVSCAILRDIFALTLTYESYIRNLVVAAYPRLRDKAKHFLLELPMAQDPHPKYTISEITKIKRNQTTPPDISTDRIINTYDDLTTFMSVDVAHLLLDALSPLLDAYVDRALGRLIEPINLMFPQNSNYHSNPPSRNDMNALARTVFSILEPIMTAPTNSQAMQLNGAPKTAGTKASDVINDTTLLDTLLNLFAKAVQLFCDKIKHIQFKGKSVSSVPTTYARTAAHTHNMSLLTATYQFEKILDRVETQMESTNNTRRDQGYAIKNEANSKIQVVNTSNHPVINSCRSMLQNIEFSILREYLLPIAKVLESKLAKMHDESFADKTLRSGSNNGANLGIHQQTLQAASCSRYMAEFNETFVVLHTEHFRHLPSAIPTVQTVLQQFVSRIFSTFISHAALVRPLEEQGKLQLANDMAQLELTVDSLVSGPIKSIGVAYEEFRAFRQIIFLDEAQILRDPNVDKIRPHNVWHHLICRGPTELQLPHQMKNWSPSSYILWLESQVGSNANITDSQFLGNSPTSKTLLALEKIAWREIVECLDAYGRRVNAMGDTVRAVSKTNDFNDLYHTLQEFGGILIAGYEMILTQNESN